MIAALTVASPTLVVASSQAGVDLENKLFLFVRKYIIYITSSLVFKQCHNVETNGLDLLAGIVL